LERYAVTLWYNLSKASGSKGILILLHQTRSFVISSLTINRSFGDRPVNSPVLMAKAPVDVSTPCFLSIVI
jgi:hypothetical protein